MKMDQDIIVGLLTCYGLDGGGSISCGGKGFFSFPKCTQTSLGVHPVSSIRYKVCYWGVMQPGHGVDHAPLFGAKVRTELSDTFTLCL